VDGVALIKKFEGILGPEGVISGREQLRTYERDSLAGYAAVPKLGGVSGRDAAACKAFWTL
jgi:glycolate oxidase